MSRSSVFKPAKRPFNDVIVDIVNEKKPNQRNRREPFSVSCSGTIFAKIRSFYTFRKNGKRKRPIFKSSFPLKNVSHEKMCSVTGRAREPDLALVVVLWQSSSFSSTAWFCQIICLGSPGLLACLVGTVVFKMPHFHA